MKNLGRLSEIRLGQTLVEADDLTPEQLGDAINQAKEHDIPLTLALTTLGYASEWAISKAVVRQFQIPFIHVENIDIPRHVKELIPTVFLNKYMILPIHYFDSILTLAMPGMVAPDVIRQVERMTGVEVFLYTSLVSEIRAKITELFSGAAHSGGWREIFDQADEKIQEELRMGNQMPD